MAIEDLIIWLVIGGVAGWLAGQRVEVNKIVLDVVTDSLAVEFQCCWTRMARNFPSYLTPQNVVEGTKW